MGLAKTICFAAAFSFHSSAANLFRRTIKVNSGFAWKLPSDQALLARISHDSNARLGEPEPLRWRQRRQERKQKNTPTVRGTEGTPGGDGFGHGNEDETTMLGGSGR